MGDLFNDKMENIKDRYLQSSFSLWNAILTINGILLAAFSVVKSDSPIENYLVMLATVLCVISIGCIVYNFISAKATYYRIGEVLNNCENGLTDEERKKDIDNALLRNKLMAYSERLCLLILVADSLIVLGLVGIRLCANKIT